MNVGSLTFASPELLLALLLVPIALVAYLLLQRRRTRYVVRFTNVAPIATTPFDRAPEHTAVAGADLTGHLYGSATSATATATQSDAERIACSGG